MKRRPPNRETVDTSPEREDDSSIQSTDSKTDKLYKYRRPSCLSTLIVVSVASLVIVLSGEFYLQKFSPVGVRVMIVWAVDRYMTYDQPVLKKPLQFKAPELVRHEICGGCRLEKIKSVSTGDTCGQWMDYAMLKENVTISEAGRLAAKRFPGDCKHCDSSCATHHRNYWDADVAAPHILRSRTMMLDSIPVLFRIPRDALADLDTFFSQPKNQHPYLWEWNPTTIEIPPEQVPHRLAWNTKKERPVYLSTFRVSKQQNCFRNNFDHIQSIGNQHPQYKLGFTNLVGVALLREDFSIIEEGLFRFQSVLGKDQDLRLFVFPPEEGSTEKRIYISSFQHITRLWLVPPPDMKGRKETKDKKTFFDVFRNEENQLSVILEREASCCTVCTGKNFNYFVDDSGQVMVETLPMAPHTVEHLDFTKDCDTSVDSEVFKGTTVRDSYVPMNSFPNTDELYFLENGIYELPYSVQHGTACCVRIPDPRIEGSELLVGISHTKSQITPEMRNKFKKKDIESRQYTSYFYAFEPKLPYRVVALSGGFCLSNPTDEETEENFYNQIVRQRPFMLGGRKLNCPYITFLSGITDKAGDPSRAIISYGLNDCTSRIVEVSKAEIIMMLFDPLARMGNFTVE